MQMETVLKHGGEAGRGMSFFAIAGFGALLSIISIAVLPEFQKAAIPDEVSVQRLRTSLDSGQVAWEARHGVPLAFAIDTAAREAIRAGTTARARALNELYARQEELATVWDAQRAALAAQTREAVRATVFAYGTEVTQPGDRDRVRRLLELKAWHQSETARASASLDSARAHLVGANVALYGARRASGNTLDSVRVAEAGTHMQAAGRLLAVMPGFQPVPARPEPKLMDGPANWHPFAALSGWLRSQRSLELASIIGMIGVGLLGAAVSTVVRGAGTGEASIPVGNDPTGVLMRGFTAAFATFLAIKGSLAVVSTDSAPANPYVLLLTCFVAAVYWEDAWARVRKLVSGDPGKDGPVKDKPTLPKLKLPGDDPHIVRDQGKPAGDKPAGDDPAADDPTGGKPAEAEPVAA